MTGKTVEQMGPHWTEVIPQYKTGWEGNISDNPVVKVTHSTGVEEHALVTPVFKSLRFHGRVAMVGFHYEMPSEWYIAYPVAELKRGVLGQGDEGDIVDFAGFAGDPEHTGRQWSELPGPFTSWGL